MTSVLIKKSEIAQALASLSPDEIALAMVENARQLQSFWQRGVQFCADNSNLPDEKRDKHLQATMVAFDAMIDWRLQRVKYVKKRRDEIDSAVSLTFNAPLQSSISRYAIAATVRNLTMVFRPTLYACTGGYHDDDLVSLACGLIYDIAAVRTLFPIDSSSLVSFSPGSLFGSPEELDNFHIMMDRGCASLGLSQANHAMNEEAALVWENFRTPRPFHVDEALWSQLGDGMATKVYYQSMQDFHNR